MVLMLLSQGDLEFPLALFDSVEEGRRFACLLPGYALSREVTEDGDAFEYETIDPKAFPEYAEIAFEGNLLPLTRFMFPHAEPVDIFWQELPYLNKPGQGLVAGSTRVDAYMVANSELKAYIDKREAAYNRLRRLLEKKGYRAWRGLAGSEDGEAILFQKQGQKDEHILAHLDPDILPLADMTDDELGAWLKDALEGGNR